MVANTPNVRGAGPRPASLKRGTRKVVVFLNVKRASVTVAVLSLVVIGLTRTVPAASEKIVFQPHRAVYEVSLARVSAGSSIADLSGRMIYELSGSPCAGYDQVLRFITRTTNQNGDAQLNDLRTKSWESPTSDTLRFDIENYHGQTLAEASKGTAERDASNSQVRVVLEKPTAKAANLGAKILFPVAHSMAVLRAALAGKKIFPSFFYDGSESGEKVYQTNAVIGLKVPAIAAPETDAKSIDPLKLAKATQSWPVAMSYYDVAELNVDGTPSFEMSYRFHLNGVTSKFQIDHGDFAFKGTLSQLVYTAPAGCKGEQRSAP